MHVVHARIFINGRLTFLQHYFSELLSDNLYSGFDLMYRNTSESLKYQFVKIATCNSRAG